jgi:hypothetical protein
MQWTPHFYEVVTVASCNEYLLLKTTKEKQEQCRQVQTGAPVFQGHLCTAPTAISYRWRHPANHAWGSSACHIAFFFGLHGNLGKLNCIQTAAYCHRGAHVHYAWGHQCPWADELFAEAISVWAYVRCCIRVWDLH